VKKQVANVTIANVHRETVNATVANAHQKTANANIKRLFFLVFQTKNNNNKIHSQKRFVIERFVNYLVNNLTLDKFF